jgi:glycosyltransferase involved in cell wall biosynthesis
VISETPPAFIAESAHAPEISVALCTHNPRRDYLEQTLAGLRQQTLTTGCWEFLLVDNASAAGCLTEGDWAWHPAGRLLAEPTLGLTHARLRAMGAAKAELLLFVDDDNALAPDYLEQALAIARGWPMLGIWGGDIQPDFDEDPPAWTRPYWQFLALRDVSQPRWTNQASTPDMVPYGAGFCLRRSVWEAYQKKVVHDPVRLALGRTGTSLASAEDVDLWHECLELGLGVGLFPQLRLRHLIPPGRLDGDYLLRLVESNQYCLRLLSHVRSRCLLPTDGGHGWRGWLKRLREEVRLAGLPEFEKQFRRAWRRGVARADQDAQGLLRATPPEVTVVREKTVAGGKQK